MLWCVSRKTATETFASGNSLSKTPHFLGGGWKMRWPEGPHNSTLRRLNYPSCRDVWEEVKNNNQNFYIEWRRGSTRSTARVRLIARTRHVLGVLSNIDEITKCLLTTVGPARWGDVKRTITQKK